MVNLGYYIKATELAEFGNFIEAMLKLKGLTQNFKELKDGKNTENAWNNINILFKNEN